MVISAPYILDATELGDLLEMAEVESIIGAESQGQTGEMHAVEGDPQPLDQQAISWCFAIDHLEGEDHTIDKPEDYDFWNEYKADFWPGKQLSWLYPSPVTLETVHRQIFHADFRHRYTVGREIYGISGAFYTKAITPRGHSPVTSRLSTGRKLIIG